MQEELGIITVNVLKDSTSYLNDILQRSLQNSGVLFKLIRFIDNPMELKSFLFVEDFAILRRKEIILSFNRNLTRGVFAKVSSLRFTARARMASSRWLASFKFVPLI